MKKVMAFALAGGRTEKLSVLTRPRSVAAVPVAGKFRLIDFTLSNCIHSELHRVAVLAQYAPLSLAHYLGRGEPWDLNRRGGGVAILQPYARQEGARWYQGSADALRQNLDTLVKSGAEHVFVLSTDLIYKMDYSWMLEAHLESGARATLAVSPPPYGETHRFGMLETDDGDRILAFTEKPARSEAPLAFMGVYLFDAAWLTELLYESDGANLILDVLAPRLVSDPDIRTYRYDGYWDDVGTIEDYYRAHQRLLDPEPRPDLYDSAWKIFARSEELPPAFFHPEARVHESLVANGAVIEGTVHRSVISPGVHVGPGVEIRDSIIFNGTVLGPDARVERSILDKNIIVGARAQVGAADGAITVVGKWARVSEGRTVAPGTEIDPGEPLAEEMMRSMEIGL